MQFPAFCIGRVQVLTELCAEVTSSPSFLSRHSYSYTGKKKKTQAHPLSIKP